MASRQNLQATVNFCAPYINYQPVTIGGMEPALSSANIVLQTILGPPFCWAWNRASVTFTCAAGTTDYAVNANDYGFAEKAWLVLADSSKLFELQPKPVLGASIETGRPASISLHGDNGAGQVTFRLMPAPNEAYAVTVLYQKKAAQMNCLASTWAPVPDELAYVYQWGFLAFSAMLVSDGRFPIFNQKFISHLLGAQEGLDDVQRNIFLGNWLEIVKSAERATDKTRQGVTARGQ